MHGQAASELLVGALWELPGLAMGRGLPGGLYRAGSRYHRGTPIDGWFTWKIPWRMMAFMMAEIHDFIDDFTIF